MHLPFLVALLPCELSDEPTAHYPTSILDYDLVHVVISLILCMPYLFTRAGSPVPLRVVPTFYANEQHLITLGLVAQLVQVVLLLPSSRLHSST